MLVDSWSQFSPYYLSQLPNNFSEIKNTLYETLNLPKNFVERVARIVSSKPTSNDLVPLHTISKKFSTVKPNELSAFDIQFEKHKKELSEQYDKFLSAVYPQAYQNRLTNIAGTSSVSELDQTLLTQLQAAPTL